MAIDRFKAQDAYMYARAAAGNDEMGKGYTPSQRLQQAISTARAAGIQLPSVKELPRTLVYAAELSRVIERECAKEGIDAYTSEFLSKT